MSLISILLIMISIIFIRLSVKEFISIKKYIKDARKNEQYWHLYKSSIRIQK